MRGQASRRSDANERAASPDTARDVALHRGKTLKNRIRVARLFGEVVPSFVDFGR